MSETFETSIISGSSDGKGINISGSSWAYKTTIHTGPSSGSVMDEILLWVSNSHTSSVNLYLSIGEVVDPTANSKLITIPVPSQQGFYYFNPGIRLNGNATPFVIYGWASTVDKLVVFGNVNRRTTT